MAGEAQRAPLPAESNGTLIYFIKTMGDLLKERKFSKQRVFNILKLGAKFGTSGEFVFPLTALHKFYAFLNVLLITCLKILVFLNNFLLQTLSPKGPLVMKAKEYRNHFICN